MLCQFAAGAFNIFAQKARQWKGERERVKEKADSLTDSPEFEFDWKHTQVAQANEHYKDFHLTISWCAAAAACVAKITNVTNYCHTLL